MDYKIGNSIVSLIDDRKYAILIDCGSSGSRLYIYLWRENEVESGLTNIKRLRDKEGKVITFKVRPGLSTFVDNPKLSVAHIYDLIVKSYTYIPEYSVSKTIVYVLATGGMRLVPQNKAKVIMSLLYNELPKVIKYKVNRVEIIPGSMEGVFMWISLNYVLGNFRSCKETSGSFEVGGASLQLAFEVNEKSSATCAFTYRCPYNNNWIEHNVYGVTFLGLGVNSAYKYYQENFDSSIINDNCLADKCKPYYKEYNRIGTGDSDKCYKDVNKIFDKYFHGKEIFDTLSKFKKSLNKISQEKMKFYGLSEFWYAFKDLLNFSGELDPDKYWLTVQSFCSTNCTYLMRELNESVFQTKEEKYLKLQCFKAPYLRYLNNKYLPSPPNNYIMNIDTYNGEEIEWTYGAIIYYISHKHT